MVVVKGIKKIKEFLTFQKKKEESCCKILSDKKVYNKSILSNTEQCRHIASQINQSNKINGWEINLCIYEQLMMFDKQNSNASRMIFLTIGIVPTTHTYAKH